MTVLLGAGSAPAFSLLGSSTSGLSFAVFFAVFVVAAFLVLDAAGVAREEVLFTAFAGGYATAGEVRKERVTFLNANRGARERMKADEASVGTRGTAR